MFDDYEMPIRFNKFVNDIQFDDILIGNKLDALNVYDEYFHDMDNLIIINSTDHIDVVGPFIFE